MLVDSEELLPLAVAMIDELELRQEIAKAVNGLVSFAGLYSWLMSRSWNMHKDSAASAIDLANNVEDLFFDRADGFLAENDLRLALMSLLNNVVINVNDIPSTTRPPLELARLE